MGIIAAIAIGVDCAINAFIYMTMAGGFYILPPFLIACCIVTLLLNSILYFQDIPSAFATLYNDLSIPSLSSIFTMKFWINSLLYLIATASAITMGAFTYYSYLHLPAMILIPQPLIILFCLAYMVGTFAIMKEPLDNLITENPAEGSKEHPKKYNFMKVINKIKKLTGAQLCIFLIGTPALLAGCIFTQLTVLGGMQGGLMALSPALAQLAIPMFALFLLAEIAFTVNAMLYICTELDIKDITLMAGLAAAVSIVLNSICNAAITKASIKSWVYITQALGSALSAAIMTKALHQFKTDFWSSNETNWHSVYNALFFVGHLAVLGIAAFLINTVIMPIIAPAVGLFGAFAIGSVLLALVFTVAQAIDVYSSGYTPNTEITSDEDPTNKTDIPANADITKNNITTDTTRKPLIAEILDISRFR